MTKRQREAWSLSALSVSAVMLLAGLNWVWVLAGCGAAALIRLLLLRLGGTDLAKKIPEALGKPVGTCVLLLGAAWMTLVLAKAARAAGKAYPEDGVETLSTVVLLALAALAYGKGSRTGMRAACVLSLFLAVLYGILLLAALRDVEWRWCMPEGSPAQAAVAFSVGLLPAAALWLPGEQTVSPGGLAIQTAAPAALALVTAGLLSRAVCRQEAMPFYTMTKSLSLFSVMERVEPLLSGALLMGFFCAASLLLSGAVRAVHSAVPDADEKRTALAVSAAALGLSWFVNRLPQGVWVVGSMVFWGIFPLITLWIVVRKKG